MKNTIKIIGILICSLVWIGSSFGQCPTCPTTALNSYLVSDQKDDYYCSPNNVNVSLNVGFPDNFDPDPSKAPIFLNPISDFTWGGAATGNNSSSIITSSGGVGSYSLTLAGTAQVVYYLKGICGGVTTSVKCTSIVRSPVDMTIRDGNNPDLTTYTPVHYWPFEPSSGGSIQIIRGPLLEVPANDIAANSCTPTNYFDIWDYQYDIMTPKCGLLYETKFNMIKFSSNPNTYLVTQGQVGNCAVVDNLSLNSAMDLGVSTRLSQEFLIKFDNDFLASKFNVGSDFFRMGFDNGEIQCQAIFTSGTSTSVTRILSVPMNGIDRKNWNYYLDDEWHHIAVTADLERGIIKMYVDGISPEGFTLRYFRDNTVADRFDCGYTASCAQTFGPNTDNGATEFGLFDEYAVYTDVLPAELIFEHYENAKINGAHYSFNEDPSKTYCTSGANFDPDIFGSNIEKYYPTGYNYLSGGIVATSIATPFDQIKNSSGPRYLPSNTLIRNFPWYASRYVGQNPNVHTIDNDYSKSEDINKELALHWNYHTFIGNSNPLTLGPIQKFANDHPEIPSSMYKLWNSVRLRNIGFLLTPNDWGMIQPNSQKSVDYYLKDNNGVFLKDKENDPIMTPAGSMKILEIDGKSQNQTIMNGSSTESSYHDLTGLQRPLDFLNEDGEVRPIYDDWEYDHIHNGFNPSVVNEYASHENNGGTWESYTAFSKNKMRAIYRDEIMEKNLLLKDRTKFSYYSNDGYGGTEMFRNKAWSEFRKIQKNFSGTNFYSTTDYYPKGPWAWNTSFGDRKGLSYVQISRSNEIAHGDKLFSPFVNAGWHGDPTYDLRPGQYLGLLKALGNLGAEFYYGSYFSNVPNGNIQHPEHWIWQLTTPSYAQAITSRYEKILREGELLSDPDLHVTGLPNEHLFGLKGGGGNVYTVVRKWENSAEPLDIQYVISTTNQPMSNTQSPNEKIITLNHFDNDSLGDLSIRTRMQGSTYILRKDEVNYTEPVFIQLDGWHEPWHPTRWEEDFVFEAEVPDEEIQITPYAFDRENMAVRTRITDANGGNETVPKAIDEDYSHFVSYYTFPSFDPHQNSPSNFGVNSTSPNLTYRFRVTEISDYRLYIRARVSDKGVSTISGININLRKEENQTQVYSDYMGCIDDFDWNWYSYGLCEEVDFKDLETGYYLLDLFPENEFIEIDKIILDKGMDRPAFHPTSPMAGRCSSSVPNASPYQLDLDFTWKSNCEGEVQFTSKIWPLLDPSCGNNIQYDWSVEGIIGTVFNIETSGLGIGTYAGSNFNFSGTYENPVFDFQVPGEYEINMSVVVNNQLVNIVTKTMLVHENPSVLVSGPNSACEGQKISLVATVSGGLGPYSFSWFPSLTAIPSTTSNTNGPVSVDVYPNQDGNHTYEVTVTDDLGCQAKATKAIVVSAPLKVDILAATATINSNYEICYGLKGTSLPVQLEANVDPCTTVPCTNSYSAPTGTVTYQWDATNNDQITSGSTSQTVGISNPNGLETRMYQVTVTDASGCNGEASQVLLVKPSNITVTADGTNNTVHLPPVCQGTAGVINLGGATASPSGSYIFKWSGEKLNSKGPTVLNSSTGSSVTAGAINTEKYPTLFTVTATETLTGCTGKGYVWLDVTDEIMATVTPTTDVNCLGSPHNVLLSAGYSGTVSGTPNYTWAPATYLSTTSGTATTFTPPASAYLQVYTVTILDGAGPCYSEASTTMEVKTCKKGSEDSNNEESTSIEKEVTEKGSILLFPNPNNGTFQLQFTGELENEVLNVVVLDLQGKVITQKIKTNGELLNFEMKDLPRGVYFIRLFNDNYNLRVSTVID